MRKIALILSIVVTIFVISCSGKKSFQPYSSLVNQGILPLSTTNAYLGSNLFIAEEAEKSKYLYNFLKARGGPMAIELTQSEEDPPHLLMYFPKDNEVYAAEIALEEIAKGQFFREWVIRGPYALERKDYKELSRLDASFAGEPLFKINGKEQRFRFSRDDRVKTILVPVVPTPLPTRPARPAKKVIKVTEEHKPPEENVRDFKPMNLDQQAIMMAKGYAERAENGDVVHTVHGAAETIAAIAKWYTGSASNAAAVAQANHLDAQAALTEGQRIIVPMAHLKTAKVMPAGFN